MAPREREVEEHINYMDEKEEDEENEEYNIGNREERREYIAEVRVLERQQATREMNRNAELQHELRQSVTAMEQMIESQQRIERIQRSLAYLRDLHARMLAAGVGQESDDEDEDSEDEGVCSDDDNVNEARIQHLTNTNRPPAENTKRVQTISESSDVSMKDAEEDEGKT